MDQYEREMYMSSDEYFDDLHSKKPGRPKGSTKQNKKKLNDKKTKNKKGKKMIYVNGVLVEDTNYRNLNLLPDDKKVNIKTSTSSKNRGYIFYFQKDIQDIYLKSGIHAIKNEFQVHYWFLNFRFKAEDSSIIDIAVPTCYFNYKQEVTSGHVDFELTDVSPVSEKLVPLHNMKVNQLMGLGIKEKIEELFNNKLQFEAMSVNFGTLHRHPGSSASQAFSTTDLNTDVKTVNDALGVVFPLADAEDDKPSFSAIIAIDGVTAYGGYNYAETLTKDGKTANLAHCEYRVANGNILTGLHYEKCKCIAFQIEEPDVVIPSVVQQLFGEEKKVTPKTRVRFNNTDNKLFPVEEKLLDIFQELNSIYSASTDAVFAENVTEKETQWQKTQRENKERSQSTFARNNNGTYGYSYGDDFFGDDIGLTPKEIEANKELARKAKQTVSMQPLGSASKNRFDTAVEEIKRFREHNNFRLRVNKYASIENIDVYAANQPNTVEQMRILCDDYNILSSVYNNFSAQHQEEDVENYRIGNSEFVMLRDIKDLLEDNILIAKNAIDDTVQNFKEVIDYTLLETYTVIIEPSLLSFAAVLPVTNAASYQEEIYKHYADVLEFVSGNSEPKTNTEKEEVKEEVKANTPEEAKELNANKEFNINTVEPEKKELLPLNNESIVQPSPSQFPGANSGLMGNLNKSKNIVFGAVNKLLNS